MLFKSAAALLTFAGLVAAQGTLSGELKRGSANVTNLNGTFFYLLAFLSSLCLPSITAKGGRNMPLIVSIHVCLSVCLFVVSFHVAVCAATTVFYLLPLASFFASDNSMPFTLRFLSLCLQQYFFFFFSHGDDFLPYHAWQGDTFSLFLQHNQFSGVYTQTNKQQPTTIWNLQIERTNESFLFQLSTALVQ